MVFSILLLILNASANLSLFFYVHSNSLVHSINYVTLLVIQRVGAVTWNVGSSFTTIFQYQDIVVIRLFRLITIKTNFHGHRLPQYVWLRASKCVLCQLGHTILVLHSRKKSILLPLSSLPR